MSGFSQISEEDIITEDLDPRIPVELDRLNNLSSEINELESKGNEAHENFRLLLSQSSSQLKLLASDIGPKSIEKARPYYEALNKAREAQRQTQMAAIEYQRANGIHKAAKETIKLAEAKFNEIALSETSRFDAAWQEMLNHATQKVNESEAHKLESEQRHRQTAAEFTQIDRYVTHLENALSKSLLNKTRPYFESKDKYNLALEDLKNKITKLQKDITARKEAYRRSLKTLEYISETIHKKRMFNNGNQNSYSTLNAKQEPNVQRYSLNEPITSSTFSPIQNSPFNYPLIRDGSQVTDLSRRATHNNTQDLPLVDKRVSKTVSFDDNLQNPKTGIKLIETNRMSLQQLDHVIRRATRANLFFPSTNIIIPTSSDSGQIKGPDVAILNVSPTPLVSINPTNPIVPIKSIVPEQLNQEHLDIEELSNFSKSSSIDPLSTTPSETSEEQSAGHPSTPFFERGDIEIKLDDDLTEDQMNTLIKNVENLTFANYDSMSDSINTISSSSQEAFRPRSATYNYLNREAENNDSIPHVTASNKHDGINYTSDFTEANTVKPTNLKGKNISELIMLPTNLKIDFPSDFILNSHDD